MKNARLRAKAAARSTEVTRRSRDWGMAEWGRRERVVPWWCWEEELGFGERK